MTQQINLCTPLFLIEERYFAAATVARALVVFVVLAGALLGLGVWGLDVIVSGYQQSVASNQKEVERLRAAITLNKANSAPADAALIQELQARQAELLQRQRLLGEMRRGLVREGWGHSARLQLLAQSIPAQAWVTGVKADEQRLELSGYTLDPASLNAWVARLSTSPLLDGQQLAVVKVERVSTDTRGRDLATASPRPGAGAPLWSYTLVTAMAPVLAPASGARP